MFRKIFLCVALAMLCPAAAWADSPPVVSNVTASQRADGSMIVDIYYDLADADGNPSMIALEVRYDAGVTWDVPAVNVSGDVGNFVWAGSGKHVIWDSAADIPNVSGTQFQTRICAEDIPTPPPGMVPIPPGEFFMGSRFDEGGNDELPRHAVNVDVFFMDRYEVTNQQYADALNWAFGQGNLISVIDGAVYKYFSGTSYPYCSTTSAPANYPHYGQYSQITWNESSFGVVGGKENHPMGMVSWYGAAAYANWRSAMEGRTPSYNSVDTAWPCNFNANGYRLPTEAEWEKAARGGLYNPYRRYPWGDTIDGSKANYSGSGDPYETGAQPWTTPAGYYNGNQTPPGVDMGNGYGLYDMAGNVWEWCNDWWGETYYSVSPYGNPRGPASGTYRVLRGGGWNDDANNCGCAFRNYYNPDNRYNFYGFRLALDSE